MELGPIGVGLRTDTLDAGAAVALAAQVERQGYAVAWLTDSLGRDPFVQSGWLLAHTERLIVATGIANIYLRSAVAVRGAQMALAEQSGNRFLLGLGVSHAEMLDGLLERPYRRPLEAMNAYLDALEEAPYVSMPPAEPPPVVLAALGPRMLALSAKRTRGAFPVQVTPTYTKRARRILGPDAWLCIKQYAVLDDDVERDMRAARARLETSLSFENYRRNLRTLGFTDGDFSDGGSDRLVEALMPIGDVQKVRARIDAHLAAGATHVCVEPIDPRNPRALDVAALEVLAPANEVPS
jgi:probable F420-dependent oxidoreductase